MSAPTRSVRLAVVVLVLTASVGMASVAHRDVSPVAGVDGWGEPFRLTDNTSSQYLAYGHQHSVAVDTSGNVHVVWLDFRGSVDQIGYRRWSSASGTWDPETILTAASVDCQRPGVACDVSGNVHVVWHMTGTHNGIWYKRWTAALGAWAVDAKIFTPDTILVQSYPSVACRPGGNDVHVTWVGRTLASPVVDQVWHIEYVFGTGWGPVTQLTDAAIDHDNACVAVDGDDDVYVTWSGGDLGDTIKQTMLRTRTGGTWQPIEQVSNTNPGQHHSNAAVVVDSAGNDVHVAWRGIPLSGTGSRIWYRCRSGGVWGGTDTVSDYADQQYGTALALAPDGGVHVAWRGYTAESPGERQVLYRSRAGGTWGAVYQLTQRTEVFEPGVACGPGGRVHVVWHDHSTGNYDPWYLERLVAAVDAGVLAIMAPGAEVLRGVPQSPVVVVSNDGTSAQAGVPVHVTVDSSGTAVYAEDTLTGPLGPGAVDTVTLPAWTPGGGAGVTLTAWTALPGDGDPANDTLALAVAMLDYTETFDDSAGGFYAEYAENGWELGEPSEGATWCPSPPRCWGTDLDHNYGSHGSYRLTSPMLQATLDYPSVSYWMWMASIAPGDGGNIKYSVDGLDWNVITGCTPGYSQLTSLSNAGIPGESAYGGARDVWEQVRAVVPVPVGQTFWLRWHFGSDGSSTDDGWYIDDVAGAGMMAIPGQRPPWDPGWTEVTPVPSAPSLKPVKSGGWLVADEGSGFLYGAKGNRTNDFYRFDVLTAEWTQLPGMPYTTHPLWPKKAPGKGSSGVWDRGDFIYCTQGNNSLGFWRFNIADSSWRMLTDVPLGAGKKVKGGTDLAYVVHDGVGYVYLLKGYACEFYRYSVQTGLWENLEPAPASIYPKWKKGSWLVAEDADATVLYAHKAKYNELWAYSTEGDSWVGLTGMPFIGSTGRRKRSKDGGCAVWFATGICALKGGNTKEFWYYEVPTGVWSELDTIPSNGSSSRKRRVKDGADITTVQGVLFALKGNKCREAWRYLPRGAFTDGDCAAGRPVLAAGAEMAPAMAFAIAPNPAVGQRLVLSGTLPAAAPGQVTIYDAAGRTVWRRAVPAGRGFRLGLDPGSFAPGVYFAHLVAGDARATRKLVVQ